MSDRIRAIHINDYICSSCYDPSMIEEVRIFRNLTDDTLHVSVVLDSRIVKRTIEHDPVKDIFISIDEEFFHE